MPKGCVSSMDELFLKMPGNMSGLGPGRKLLKVLKGQSLYFMLLVRTIFIQQMCKLKVKVAKIGQFLNH